MCEEDGKELIRVRTIKVGKGDNARVECLNCHRIIKPSSLKAHLSSNAHVYPHVCDLCDTRSTRRADLGRHLKVVHDIDKPFKCTQCQRSFGDEENHRHHLSTRKLKFFQYNCQVSRRILSQRFKLLL